MKFNGSSFDMLGTSPSQSGRVSYISFAIHDNIPYIAYIDTASGNKISVKKYDAGTWTAVGGYVSNNEADYPSLEIDENGTLYLVYRDRAQSLRPVVRRYNGNSWEPLDGNEIVENVVCIDQNKICVRNNRIYVMFENDISHLIVKEYLH